MRRRVAEGGEGNLGWMFWLLILGLAVLIAFKMVPVKIATSQLYDHMENSAHFAANETPAQIAKCIVGKAKELELPVNKEDVQVQRVGENIHMHAAFTVPVDFPGYTSMCPFDMKVTRPIFIF